MGSEMCIRDSQRSIPFTRVSEYQINESDLTATLIWQYSHPNGYVSLNQGCAQRLDNGNTLISWGGVAGHGQIITEIDTSDQRVLEIEYPQSCHSYKVRKSDWSFNIDLLKGDINLDGDIDILDIIVTMNYILSDQEPDLFYLYKLDLDFSGGIDVSDILMLLDGII